MEYLHVLSRPMVINHDHDITWTEAYIDSKVGPQRSKQGLLGWGGVSLPTSLGPIFSKVSSAWMGSSG